MGEEAVFTNYGLLKSKEIPEGDWGFAGKTFKEAVEFHGTFTGKAIFKGCTFEKYLDFSNATFKGKVDFSGAVFKQGASFRNATFITNGADVSFEGAEFLPFDRNEVEKLKDEKEIDEVDFSSAKFGQEYLRLHGEYEVSCGRTKAGTFLRYRKKGSGEPFASIDFSAGLDGGLASSPLYQYKESIFRAFTSAKSNPGSVNFTKCRFSKNDQGSKMNVSFMRTQYFNAGVVSFWYATFASAGVVSFGRATFANAGVVSFAHTTLANAGVVSFGHATLANADLVDFGHATFASADWVDFGGATFASAGVVSFGGATFANAGWVNFWYATFANAGGVYFGYATFANAGGVSFGYAKFEKTEKVLFLSTIFLCKEVVDFSGTQFPAQKEQIFDAGYFDGLKTSEEKVTFDGATLPQTTFKNGSLRDKAVVLRKILNDSGVPLPLPQETEKWIKELEKAGKDKIPTERPVFDEDIVVSWKGISEETAKNITFRNVNLHGSLFDGKTLSHVKLVNPFWRASKTGHPRKMLYEEELLSAKKEVTDQEYQNLLAQYIDLKNHYENEKNFLLAGDFHYGEMEVRYRYAKMGLFDKAMTWAYRMFTGYGESMERALSWLALLVFIVVPYLLSFPLIFPAILSWDGLSSLPLKYFQSIADLITPFSWHKDGEGITSSTWWHWLVIILGQIALYIQLPLFVLAVRRRFKR